MAEAKQLKTTGDEPYKAMEAADENQIVEALKGYYVEGMVYRANIGGRNVIGVSYSGIKEIAYQLARESGRAIDIEIVDTHEDNDSITYTVKAIHKGIGTRIGVATQLKKFGNGGIDQFARVKALSKAQRNAMRAVLPELAIKQFIELYQNKGQVVNLGPQSAAAADASYTVQPPEPQGEPQQQAPPEQTGKKTDKQGRWTDEKGYWNGDDAGFTDAPGLPDLPAYYAAPLQEVGLSPADFAVKIYKGAPVVATKAGYIDTEIWKKATAVFKKLGLAYCKAGKSNHWFILPGTGKGQ